ncbi:hypothetical protein NPIL_592831 [Nephila pilipes]|uniref:Uncharacterized protein n=1 Tax=Nephila pilipes TaxID=299642 RepID=A0A8X6PMA3_NEPPI|nr:hypothetical protein NPIL_592831 [Nephila pilipes]
MILILLDNFNSLMTLKHIQRFKDLKDMSEETRMPKEKRNLSKGNRVYGLTLASLLLFLTLDIFQNYHHFVFLPSIMNDTQFYEMMSKSWTLS